MEDNEMAMHEHMHHDTGQQAMEQHPSHKEHNHMEHEEHIQHGKHDAQGKYKDHTNHHEMMVEDFKRRFFISVIITIPILLLSPIIREFLFTVSGIIVPGFNGDIYVLFLLSTIIFFYGGWPFLKGIRDELTSHTPWYDDPDSYSYHGCIYIQQSSRVWPDGNDILLGAGNTYRYHAAWTLVGDAFYNGSFQGTGATGQAITF